MNKLKFGTNIGLSLVLMLAGALSSGEAAAVNRLHDFGLKQVSSECAAPGRYNVRLSFNAGPKAAEFVVASGNKCQLRNVVCGINGGCGTVSCKGPGPCTLVLGQCQQSRGGSWVGIATAGGHQRMVTSAPRRCT
jgi:hypothetical protein